MTWLNHCIKSAVSLLACMVFFDTYGQETFNKDLFFCHENIEIKYLWPVGESRFIANVKYPGRVHGKAMNLSNMFLLFDQSHLVSDTLYASNMGRTVTVLDEKNVLFSNRSGSKKYMIANGKFEEIEKIKNPDFQKALSEESNGIYMLGPFNGLKVGYETRAKNRTLKRSKKNIPRFFYINNNGEKVYVNSGKEEIVSDQWESFLNKIPFALGDVSLYKEDLYINIPMIGIGYMINTKSLKINTYIMPEADSVKSWLLTVDQKTGANYLVGHRKDKTFDIFHIDLSKNKKTFLKNVEGYMDLIYNDQILLRQDMVEEKKRVPCYYLTNAYTN